MVTEPLQAFFFRDFKNSYIPNILEEIYKDRVYAPFLTDQKDLTIVDWGANIGLTSYFFKEYAKQVYAVEPSKRHQEVIETMLEYNKIDNVKLCKYAISNEDGKTKFYHNDNVTMFSLKDTVNKKDDFEEVETLTPESFMKREGITHIDLLKFDCEGSESEIITSEGFRNVADKIDVIVGEYHSWTSMSKEQFALCFSDLGFTFKWYTGTEASVFSAVRT